MMDSIPEDSSRIRELEAEIDRLKAEIASRELALLTSGGIQQSVLPPSNFTILGLEESLLLVDELDVIRFANNEMARLLGLSDKHALLRRSLKDIDKTQLGAGFLSSVVQATRVSDQTNILECSFKGLKLKDTKPDITGETVLQFVANCTDNKVQIVVQDVTRLRWLEKSFARYVAPEVVSQLMTLPPESLMTVSRQPATILFSDLRGFTALCEQLDAADVCELLNSHFEQITEPVNNRQGTIDKFNGDSLMAVFGVPLSCPDHTLRAYAVALEMQQRHADWINERRLAGKPAAGLGIGISSGEIVVGNIGTPARMDYTVLGQAVNMAARLCAVAEAGLILTDQQSYQAAQNQYAQHGVTADLPRMTFQSHGSMEFKNISSRVQVVEVLAKRQTHSGH